MNDRTVTSLVWAVVCAFAFGHAIAQPQRQETLVIAGQPDQAQLVHINGKSYVDIESLARITHGALRFEGTRTVLALPGAGSVTSATASSGSSTQRLSQNFLNAQIAALAQVREWHVALVNAVSNNLPITAGLVGPIRRQTEAKLQLAVAAATSGQDHQSVDLLRNEVANMGQMSDQLLQMHAAAQYITPEVFNNNALDAKILGCQNAMAQMAASKQFLDDAQCH